MIFIGSEALSGAVSRDRGFFRIPPDARRARSGR